MSGPQNQTAEPDNAMSGRDTSAEDTHVALPGQDR